MDESIDSSMEQEFLDADTLCFSIRLYRRTFGHPIPSSEFKTAAIMGNREKLAQEILPCVLDGTPNAKWAYGDDPFAQKCFDNGLLI